MSLNDEEPKPIPNDQVNIADLVVKDMLERKVISAVKYGIPLQPFNGRDALVDLYQELLDATVYLRQLLYEQNKQ
jgi:hypothetical protein